MSLVYSLPPAETTSSSTRKRAFDSPAFDFLPSQRAAKRLCSVEAPMSVPQPFVDSSWYHHRTQQPQQHPQQYHHHLHHNQHSHHNHHTHLTHHTHHHQLEPTQQYHVPSPPSPPPAPQAPPAPPAQPQPQPQLQSRHHHPLSVARLTEDSPSFCTPPHETAVVHGSSGAATAAVPAPPLQAPTGHTAGNPTTPPSSAATGIDEATGCKSPTTTTTTRRVPNDKFTKSRAVGQSHRDNEKDHIEALEHAVEEGRSENVLLFTLFFHQYKRTTSSSSSSQRVANFGATSSSFHYRHHAPLQHQQQAQQQADSSGTTSDFDNRNGNEDDADDDGNPCTSPRSHMPGDYAEDAGVCSDGMAAAYGLHKLSTETAKRMGLRYMSAEMAAVLLETMASRRNLVEPLPDDKEASVRRRRRRTSYRTATTQVQAQGIVDYAIRILSAAATGGRFGRMGAADVRAFVDAKLGALGLLYDRYDDMEVVGNPASIEADVVCSPPMSPTRPEMAEFGSAGSGSGGGSGGALSPRRRGEGAKRCSRCHKLKVSGSGHGRSKCDDGFSISSAVPYPGLAAREDNQSAG